MEWNQNFYTNLWRTDQSGNRAVREGCKGDGGMQNLFCLWTQLTNSGWVTPTAYVGGSVTIKPPTFSFFFSFPSFPSLLGFFFFCLSWEADLPCLLMKRRRMIFYIKICWNVVKSGLKKSKQCNTLPKQSLCH